MPRRAGKGVTLGEVKRRANSCAACHAPLSGDEPIAWTWARQRIHEACMPNWAFADRGRRALGEWIAEPVGLLLKRHQGRLCSPCLALELSLSLEEARQVVEIVAKVDGFRVLPVSCETCGRSTMVLCTVPGTPATATDVDGRPGKCTHCSGPLSAGETVVSIGPGQFHGACAQLLAARDRIRSGRALSRESRARLERVRALLDRPPAPE